MKIVSRPEPTNVQALIELLLRIGLPEEYKHYVTGVTFSGGKGTMRPHAAVTVFDVASVKYTGSATKVILLPMTT